MKCCLKKNKNLVMGISAVVIVIALIVVVYATHQPVAGQSLNDFKSACLVSGGQVLEPLTYASYGYAPQATYCGCGGRVVAYGSIAQWGGC